MQYKTQTNSMKRQSRTKLYVFLYITFFIILLIISFMNTAKAQVQRYSNGTKVKVMYNYRNDNTRKDKGLRSLWNGDYVREYSDKLTFLGTGQVFSFSEDITYQGFTVSVARKLISYKRFSIIGSQAIDLGVNFTEYRNTTLSTLLFNTHMNIPIGLDYTRSTGLDIGVGIHNHWAFRRNEVPVWQPSFEDFLRAQSFGIQSPNEAPEQWKMTKVWELVDIYKGYTVRLGMSVYRGVYISTEYQININEPNLLRFALGFSFDNINLNNIN